MKIREQLRDNNANLHHVTVDELKLIAEHIDYVDRADLAQLLKRSARALKALKEHSKLMLEEVIHLSKRS